MRARLLLVAALALAGCSDSTSPANNPAGTYRINLPTEGSPLGVLTFTTTVDGVTTDQSLEGADILLVLAPDGTTSGELYIPNVPDEESGEPVDFEADLTGTWSVDGNVLTLSHDADTFLRDMPFTVHKDRLTGDEIFDDTRVRVTLIRQ